MSLKLPQKNFFLTAFIRFFFKKETLILFFILFVTSISFSESLFNGLTTWDDRDHVTENVEIRSLDASHLKMMLFNNDLHGFIPLTILSYAIEHHFFGLNSFVIHLDNLLLHLAVTALVFLFGLRLGLGIWACGLAALLFGVHPMHVESVAWATERKDVLCAFFYMLSLLSYWTYLQSGRKRSLALSFVWGALSMLAKPMALSLPFIFLICDWMKGRRFTLSVLLEKIPHLLYSVPVVWINYHLHLRESHASLFEAVLTWIWCSVFYIGKFLWPVVLVPLYTRPEPVSFLNPAYLSAFLSVILFALMMIRFRTQRWFMFACLFYFFSIFFLFRFNALEFSLVNDRYMYLPSIGFCFLFGFMIQQGFIALGNKRSLLKLIAILFLAIFFGVLSVKTYFQCRIWKDSVSVWSQMDAHNPDNWFVLYNRARVYEDMGKLDLALVDYNRVLANKKIFALGYSKRGTLLLRLGREDEALKDFDKAIALRPIFPEVFSNRALIYLHRQQYEPALADLEKALALHWDFVNAHSNQGLVYAAMKQYDRALESYTHGLQINPSAFKLYFYRSQAYANLNHWDKAVRDALKAQALGYQGLEGYIQLLKKHSISNK